MTFYRQMLSSLLIISVVTLLHFFISNPSFAVADGEVIDQVCRRYVTLGSYLFCSDALKSNPHSFKANLNGICDIAIDLALSNATTTAKKIQRLLGATRDPQLRSRFTECQEHHNFAIGSLRDTKADLKSRDYLGINAQAGASVSSAEACEDTFFKQPPYPSPLSVENENLKLLSGLVMIIGDLLKSKSRA